MTNRRRIGKIRTGGGVHSRFRKNDCDSLLKNRSPPTSPFGYEDPNISSLFPGGNSPDSFEVALNEASKKANNRGGLAPENRFHAQHAPRGSPIQDKEIHPANGALQFVPAYDESTQHRTRHDSFNRRGRRSNDRNSFQGSTWDSIVEDSDPSGFPRKDKSPVISSSMSTASLSSKNSSSLPSHQTPRSSTAPHRRERETDGMMPSGTTPTPNGKKGSRIARLASIFSGGKSNANGKAGDTYHEPSLSPTRMNKLNGESPQASPSRSSSSGGYVGWPGTQDKQGGTIAIESSYEDSSVGAPSRHEEKSEVNYHDREFRQWRGGANSRIERNNYMDPYVEDEKEDRKGDSFLSNANFDSRKRVSRGTAALTGTETPLIITPITTKVTSPTAFQVNLKTPESQSTHNPTNSHAADAISASSGRSMISSLSSFRPTPTSASSNSISRGHFFHDEHGTPKSPSARDSWEVDDPPQAPLSPAPSSAFFNESEVEAIASRTYRDVKSQTNKRMAAASVMRPKYGAAQPLTEDALVINNQLSPPHRTFNNVQGFRALLDKTKDVPNLMDEVDSDSMTSSRANSSATSLVRSSVGARSNYRSNQNFHSKREKMVNKSADTESDVFDEISKYSISDKNSDLFDGLNNISRGESQSSDAVNMKPYQESRPQNSCTYNSSPDSAAPKLVLLGGGLTTIQTTQHDFSNRRTASDVDDNLSSSDVEVPSFQEMALAGRSPNDTSLSVEALSECGTPERHNRRSLDSETFGENSGGDFDGSYRDDDSAFFSDFYAEDDELHWSFNSDLSEYYIAPSEVKKLVRRYRKMSRIAAAIMDFEELEKHEDEKKAFALFEMRSRIMEKDIERGLERRGGTVPVDDLVTTSYYQAGLRVRDAVIVSKAWRDGASPLDVINTALLTCRAERTHYIKRPIINFNNNHSPYGGHPRYWWEQVAWVDDTDFMQYRCPSLGSRNMRGFEMFTIGDCQSILLKLTNERCIELRGELNEATARQIEAEELMKEEIDAADGMMTEAEMTYLASMEDVKFISKKLVTAEKAFTLVRDRIEKLVSRYQALLAKIDNECDATSSVITYESSYYSDAYSGYSEATRERQRWARRAQRAEVRAELEAREAYLSRHEGKTVSYDQQRELERLQDKLEDLQSEPSTMLSTGKQHSVVLAKAIAAKQRMEAATKVDHNDNNSSIGHLKVDDVKKRFRDRLAAKMRNNNNAGATTREDEFRMPQSSNPISKPLTPRSSQSKDRHVSNDQNKIFSSAGEEMFQHLDFYERSLKAVEEKNGHGRRFHI